MRSMMVAQRYINLIFVLGAMVLVLPSCKDTPKKHVKIVVLDTVKNYDGELYYQLESVVQFTNDGDVPLERFKIEAFYVDGDGRIVEADMDIAFGFANQVLCVDKALVKTIASQQFESDEFDEVSIIEYGKSEYYEYSGSFCD